MDLESRSEFHQTTSTDDLKSRDDEFNKKEKATYCQTLVNYLRATVGTGFLAMPYAFSQAGYIGGVIGIMIVIGLVNYCALLLANCSLELQRRKKKGDKFEATYQQIVKLAFEEGPNKARCFSPYAQHIANIFIIIGQFGYVCAYIIFTAANLKEALDPFVGEASLRIYILCIAVPITLMNCSLSLKKVALISLAGNIILLSTIFCILYFAIGDMAHIDDVKAFGTARDFLPFIGTVFFASPSSALVITFQTEMKNPEALSELFGVLNLNALTSSILYCVFGIIGYLGFGSAANPSITLNLPKDHVLSKVIQILLALSIMTGTTIMNYVTVRILWSDYLSKYVHKKEKLMKIGLQILVVWLTVLFSVAMPNLGLMMTLVGLIAQSSIGTTFSIVIHFLCNWKQPDFLSYVKKFSFHIFIVILIVSVFFYTLVSEIQHANQKI